MCGKLRNLMKVGCERGWRDPWMPSCIAVWLWASHSPEVSFH